MQAAIDHTDWSILSHLLRCAQRDGWEIAFRAGAVEIASLRAVSGTIVLPARLVRLAREAGWRVTFVETAVAIALHHPAVQHPVRVLLGA